MPIVLNPGEQRQLDVQLTPLPIEPARLWGYVVHADTLAPVAGATVKLIGDQTYQQATDIAGLYDISPIIPGTYTVEVSHPEYETAII